MSYNTILDTYFSTKWFGYGIPLLVMILMTIFFRKKIFQNKKNPFLWRIIMIAVPFVLAITYALVNPMYWGYGNPLAIDEIHFDKGKLYVLDYTLSGGGRNSDPMECERVHVMDPATGEKKIRFRVGDQGKFVGVHGDSVSIARYDDVAYFSNESGKLLVVYSRKTLPSLFKELSSGVDNFMWGDGRNIMEISALDGTSWNLYTSTGKIYSADKKEKDKQRVEYIPTNKLSIHEREIRIDNGPGANTWLELDGENENQHKLFISKGDSTLNKDLFFLDGLPVGLDIEDSCFFILHYETLTKEKFKITCMSLDGKRKLWEIRQSDFNPSYTFPESIVPCVEADEANGRLFFNIGTEIFAVKMKDGKLLWRRQL